MPLKFNGSLHTTQLFEALSVFADALDRLKPTLRACCFVSVSSLDGCEFPNPQDFVATTNPPSELAAVISPQQTSLSVTFFLECAEVCVSFSKNEALAALDVVSSELHLFVHPYLPWGQDACQQPFVVAKPAGMVRCVIAHNVAPQFEFQLSALTSLGKNDVQKAWAQTMGEFLKLHPNGLEIDLESFLAQPAQQSTVALPDSLVPHAQVADQLQKVQKAMCAGECYLLNLTLRAQVPCSANEFTMANLLRQWQHRRSRFGICFSSERCKILSFSPERFVAVVKGWVLSEPIKGTIAAPAGQAAGMVQAQSLWNSQKERYEQTLVVDLLRNDLNLVCESGTVEVARPFFARKTPYMLQMQSFVFGKLRAALPLSRFFSSLLPAGSVTGTPKKRVCEIISEVELTPRGYYCGIFGIIENGACSESVLLIRSLFGSTQGNPQECTLGVGAGITTLSDPTLEIAEFKVKMASFMGILLSKKV